MKILQEINSIDVVSLFPIYSNGILLVERPNGTKASVTGEINGDEEIFQAGQREVIEELDIFIPQEKIIYSGLSIPAKSPNTNKILNLHIAYSYLPKSFSLASVDLEKQNELKSCKLYSIESAFNVLKENGYPEALFALEYLKNKSII